MNPDFRDLLRALSDAGARLLVVGAYAVSFHSEPRATGDLDIWIDPARDNAARVYRALGEMHTAAAGSAVPASCSARSVATASPPPAESPATTIRGGAWPIASSHR